ncbi:hypothetical protein MPER_16216, partial [Moniliophthora perniciosa FA553]
MSIARRLLSSIPPSLIRRLPLPFVSLPSLVVVLWVCFVRAFRWRRYNYIQRVYGPKYRAGTLSLEDAQAIIAIGSQYELPSLLQFSVAFALFKTYSI